MVTPASREPKVVLPPLSEPSLNLLSPLQTIPAVG
jgi:hypothetical protein